jgi:hypothetical protein
MRDAPQRAERRASGHKASPDGTGLACLGRRVSRMEARVQAEVEPRCEHCSRRGRLSCTTPFQASSGCPVNHFSLMLNCQSLVEEIALRAS